MENSELTIADLASIKSLIEAVCARGAFKAGEMRTVGAIYEKISIFVENSAAQMAAKQQQAQGETNA